MIGRIDRLALALARALALIGGAILIALIAMICISITTRALGFGPVTGDYELVELGTALAVFAFLPFCQITGAHARVDVLTHRLGPRGWALLDGLWAVALAVVMALIAWKLAEGMAGKRMAAETTFLRQIPVWWAYAGALPMAAVAALIAAWSALRAILPGARA
ncbi:TRAP transporter small permease [Paracoccus sp. p4-l81]|uniref:TRAP transporter small permease n=1 Tax=unclassified Paracoccus (in: a-proteobacteria) TaxID=2688777 RepID=UPI0035BB0550